MRPKRDDPPIMTDFIQVATTTGTEEDAEQIAAALIERRLAACVQITGPIQSLYHWQGKVESDPEWLCTAKTHRDKYGRLAAAIGELHPYDVPEILATPIVAGSEAYLKWMQEELNKSPSS